MKTYYLRTLRLTRGWSQGELARRSNVRQNQISRYETTDHSRPSAEPVIMLAKAFGVKPEQLKFGPDPHRPTRRTNVGHVLAEGKRPAKRRRRSARNHAAAA